MATILIYFLPKFLTTTDTHDPSRSMLSSFNNFSNSNLSSGGGGDGGSSNSNNMFTVTSNLIRRQSSKYAKPNAPRDMNVTEKDVTEASMNHVSRASIASSSMNLHSEIIKEDNEFEQDTDNHHNNDDHSNHHRDDDKLDDDQKPDHPEAAPNGRNSQNSNNNNDTNDNREQLLEGVVSVLEQQEPAAVGEIEDEDTV
jgi:hypothetical protein